MKKTGEILKKAREEKGLTLHEIGLSLKINSKILKAIEEGDESHLPAKTFLRGFVLSYANFLHLNTETVLETFYEEMGSTKPTPTLPLNDHRQTQTINQPSKEQEPEAKPTLNAKESDDSKNLKSLHENKNTKTIAIVVIAITLIALILFTNRVIEKYKREAELQNSTVAPIAEAIKPLPLPSLQPVESSIPVSSTETQKTQANISTNSTDSKLNAGKTESALAQNKIPDEKAPLNKSQVNPTETKNTEEPIKGTEQKPEVAKDTKEKTKNIELIVEALDAVEVEYSAPNGKPQKIRLSAEQVHTFKSKSGLHIGFSNGGAVNLILNGREVGIPGSLGKEVKLSY